MVDQEVNKKTVDDYKKDYEYFTGKASEISRNLAFAGIAIIWIFKITSKDGSLEIPSLLITPLIWLVITLALDLSQYISGGLIWLIYYRFKEWQIKKSKISANDDIKAPAILPAIIHFFYLSKLVAIVVAYIFLFRFVYDQFIVTAFYNNEMPTSCIMHLANSDNLEGVTSNKRCSCWTGSCFESPNDTIYANR